uniref:Putative secreted protein n=1 Tax=Amblyomma triste TaxID=251400 RepID=A0A023G3F4_AMBTT
MSGTAILFLCIWISSVQPCRQGTQRYYCWWGGILENLCPGVNLKLCTQYTIQCACDAHHSRDASGNCVLTTNCDKSKRHSGTGESSSGTASQPQDEERQRLTNLFLRTVEVIESYNEFHLLMASKEIPIPLCECMKSTFESRGLNDSTRTLECFYSPVVENKANLMMKLVQRVEFVPRIEEGQVKLVLKPADGGRPLCMLWETDSSDSKNRHDCCNPTHFGCVIENSHVLEYSKRCFLHDQLVKSARDKYSQR